MVTGRCDFCIECGNIVYPRQRGIIPWFCGEWCASTCFMYSMKVGDDTSPEAAIVKLSERHLRHGNEEDLKRIEKILNKMVDVA